MPAVSVVIPTYNRVELLRRTLESLARQRPGTPGFEVVVADDGSSDGTAELVRAFSARLPTRYVFQEDRGFRAAAARNAGARLATAPVLVFVDTGVLAGPDFIGAHLAAHRTPGRSDRPDRSDRSDLPNQSDRSDRSNQVGRSGRSDQVGRGDRSDQVGRPGRAVVGYTYGYNSHAKPAGLAELLADRPPEQVVARLGDLASFRDKRHEQFAEVDYDLGRLLAPWALGWVFNLSVRAESFRAVGGFDEGFRGWGTEDVELSYRLARAGVRFAVSRDAWAIETPTEGRSTANIVAGLRNARRFLRTHPAPAVELICGTFQLGAPPTALWATLERECRALANWVGQARDLDVRDELAAAVDRPSTAVLGCGGQPPPAAALIDFDDGLLRQAATRHPGAATAHAIGIRTPYPDGAFDLVVVSSRLAGLWPRWGGHIRAEAHRIGREARILPGGEAP